MPKITRIIDWIDNSVFHTISDLVWIPICDRMDMVIYFSARDTLRYLTRDLVRETMEDQFYSHVDQYICREINKLNEEK